MEVGGGELTIYDNVDAKTGKRRWGDLCRGRTCRPPGSSARSSSCASRRRTGAGRRKTPNCSGCTAPRGRPGRAQGYLKLLEEAARRDHRKLGADLDLFCFPDEIGSGLAVFHPKGGIIRRELENYSRQQHEEAATRL